MPRDLAFGNQHILVQCDRTGTIRDLYYPQVGLFNHVSGALMRVGVWVENHFSWIDWDGWVRELNYEESCLIGASLLTHHELGIQLSLTDAMHPTAAVFERRVEVRNLRENSREVRIFFAHDLRICESDIGDTAMWMPEIGMVHFKRDFWFGFPTEPVAFQYQTGFKEFKDHVGTWTDAEDGWLGMKPIEQGSVDSVVACHVVLKGHSADVVTQRMVCARSLAELRETCQITVKLDEVRAAWKSWTATPPAAAKLDPRLVKQYERSLQIMITQTDRGGAIMAANDSDILESNRATYSYMWPRDGALVAAVFAKAGRSDLAKSHFDFCKRILEEQKEPPIFLQKYSPDGTLGATWHPWIVDGEPIVPLQQDETSLTIWALGEYFELGHPVEEFYETLVAKPMTFMLAYRDENGLPLPSWDLWEERRAIHGNTVAACIAGFRAAARLAASLGRAEAADYLEAAETMAIAWQQNAFSEEHQCWARAISPMGSMGPISPIKYHPDHTVDSALMAFPLLGVYPVDDQQQLASVAKINEKLRIQQGIDGFARYENDYYFRRSDHHPGNPWIICTMWQAQWQIELGDTKSAEKWLHWVADRATCAGVLSEQYHPVTGEALSVSPLTWSHAEVVLTTLMLAESL